uniref:WD repeat and FYVE domain containing 1 n=1 Tax=Poecilia reticulata TaxID=8081 RepID=A0A3P9P140_POERE
MAAEIHSRPQTARPVLLNKIEGHSDTVNAAVLIPKEDGVITVSEDRTIRVWLKRDSGQYWPSIYHTVSSPCSCMSYHHDSRRIFIGQDNGAVVEFLISEDFNKMNHVKTYPAHQNRVSSMVFSLESEWVVSTGHDKSVSWMCTQSGSMLGRHYFTSWASCLQYDHETQHAFIGDYSGQITLLKLEKQTYSTITTLKGHEGSIGTLWWDPVQRLLFSGASDHSIIMWDIGGRKGRTLLLQGHHERVQALRYLQFTRQLLSCSADGGIAVWNMDTQREEAPQWLDSDSCQKCEQPFFWNIKQMWDTKTLGLRQVPTTVSHRGLEAPVTVVNPADACVCCVCVCVCVFVVCSTTAGSVERLCVGNAALNAPPSRSWALSSRCECATPASTPSKKKSKRRPSLNVFVFSFCAAAIKNAVIVCVCACVCVCVRAAEHRWPRSTRGNTTSPTWTWTHPEA